MWYRFEEAAKIAGSRGCSTLPALRSANLTLIEAVGVFNRCFAHSDQHRSQKVTVSSLCDPFKEPYEERIIPYYL